MTDTTVKKYRARPIVVEAIQWTGKNWEEIEAFIGVDESASRMAPDSHGVTILEHGTHYFRLVDGGVCLTDSSKVELFIKCRNFYVPSYNGDYIVKDADGEIHTFEPGIFETRYEFLAQEGEPS